MKKKKLIFWAAIVIFFGVFFINQQYTLYKLNHVKKNYQEQLSKIKLENEQLQNEAKQTKRQDYIENQAREKLGLVKPGEILIIDKDKKRE